MTDFIDLVGNVLIWLVAILLFASIPIAIILSLNELFSLGIELTLWTWLSVVVLLGVLIGGSR